MFEKMFEKISQQVGTYLPGILTALAVLIIGWIVAKIIGGLVGRALKKTGAGAKLSKLISPNGNVDASKVVGKGVFYTLMLFVLIAFFNVLNLPVVSKPLDAFLEQIFAYAPRLLSALGLGVAAYVLARLLKEVTRGGLEAIDIDTRLSNLGQDANALTSAADNILDSASQAIAGTDDEIDFGDDDGFQLDDSAPVAVAPSASATTTDSTSLTQTLPEAVYWLIIALFLPAIIGALQIPGLKEPVEEMFTKALDFLPNILGAGIIAAVGFFIAKLVRQVVSNLTAAFGVNKVASKIGLGEAGGTRISDLLGLLSFIVILAPLAVAALDALGIEAISAPAKAIIARVSGLLPNFLGAAVIIGVAVFIGRIISNLAEELLAGIGFDKVPESLGLNLSNVNPSQTPSKIGGKLVLGGIVLMALTQALTMMELGPLAAHVDTFSAFAVRLFVGLVMLGLGMFLSTLAANQIKTSGIENAAMLATVARGAILVFAGGFALQHIGVSPTIINTAFMALLGGMGVAIAIAFGWGGRDAAKRLLDRHVK
jgi:hypothetical protein